MPTILECQHTCWEDLPLVLSIERIQKLGFGRPTVAAWFKNKDFPKILGTNLVEKHAFICWLQNRKLEDLDINKKLFEQVLKDAITSKINSLFINAGGESR